MAAFFFLFGLIVGSFLNVVILRFGERPVTGRSACMHCGTTLAWYDLVPVLSWVFLLGRCRYCRKPISVQYPLVELAVAGTFAVIGASPVPLALKILALPIAALLIAILVYDLRHMLIPDLWAYLCATLALVASLSVSFSFGWGAIALSLVSGVATAAPFFFLWRISRGAWMGLGDAKLALSFGFLLGIEAGFYAIMAAFVLGAVVSLCLMLFSSEPWQKILLYVTPTCVSRKFVRRFTMKSEIPFGPFLVCSCFLVWFAQLYALPLPLMSW